MSSFVSTQWLADHLADPKVIIVDGSWHMPNSGRDARTEFSEGHIPGAVHFDIDAIADTSSDLPHMLPDPETFAAMAGTLGIASDKTIVVYDEAGLFSAPRVWWTLRVMGARDVRILEGGGPKWRAEQRPLETGHAQITPANFTVRFNPDAVADIEQVKRASMAHGQILDARPAARFTGETPEPRQGLRSGHIPNSANLPFSALIENGRLKPEAELKAAIETAGIDTGKPVITSCGSGVTAAVLALALDTVGARNVALYDGSWTEWGGRDDTPVASGGAS